MMIMMIMAKKHCTSLKLDIKEEQVNNKRIILIAKQVIVQFYSACIVRCIGLCHYYQGDHNNSEKPEKREKTKD
jgi:hypothetical protein